MTTRLPAGMQLANKTRGNCLHPAMEAEHSEHKAPSRNRGRHPLSLYVTQQNLLQRDCESMYGAEVRLLCSIEAEALFSNFGGVSRAARSMRPSGKVSAFMNQNPRKVAAFVSECLDYRRFEASDLLPYATRETLEELGLVGYQIDTFSSDYDDYIDESGMVYDAHGA